MALRSQRLILLLISVLAIMPAIVSAQDDSPLLHAPQLPVNPPDPLEALRARSPKPTPYRPQQQSYTGEGDVLEQKEPLSFREQSDFMRRFCRVNRKDPRCLEFPWTDPTSETAKKSNDPCQADPLGKLCQQKKDKILMDAYMADRICNDRPDSRRCKSARRKVQKLQ